MIHLRLSPRVPKVSIKNALNLTNGFFLDPERDFKAEEAKAARSVIEKINEFYKKEGKNHHRFNTFMDALHQEIESTLFPPEAPEKPHPAAPHVPPRLAH